MWGVFLNAKNVKDILISYLKVKYKEIRIYQEKSIGSSICDIMAVTDRLIGFEIKSDLDTYVRLENQVKAYDLFFDKNYIVIGKKHSISVNNKVPMHWGIICICDDEVTIMREAEENKNVSRRKQLSILWKLELKNLLIQNNLPSFAQKEKGYIADKIVSSVEQDKLGAQIAKELLSRDYSLYNATDYTIYSNNNNTEDFPAKEIIDTLSEKDLSNFTLDKWIEIYKQATIIKQKKEKQFKIKNYERVPHKIPYTDIEVSLGAPWINAEIINEFLYHLINLNYSIKGQKIPYVSHEPITGNWSIQSKKYLGENNINAEVKFGLKRYNALWILEATLNLREIKLYDGTVYNEKDTLIALEKQKLIKAEFKRWIWEDEYRRWSVEEAYNKIFAKYEKIVYDGSDLTFPEMNKEFDLYPYQKDAVKKIIDTKNTLLAFDVGAGKTYIMIAAAMKMREMGLSRKNMFLVPNHIVGQWEKIFSQLYPNAKVLAIEPKVFKPDMRQKVLEQIRDGDYDGIIIAYSCFEMIPLSVNSILADMNLKLKKISSAIEEIRNRQGYIEKEFYTPLSKEKEYIKTLTQDFIDSIDYSRVKDITFDSLEINTLFVDEAHNYKNIPIKTRLRNLNGINVKGSLKCQDLLHKVRYIQQTNDGRGAVFATGTPLCNSISDAYAMQMYLQYDELKYSELDVFDNWIKTFAQPEQLCEIDVDTSKYRFLRRLVKFFNLPELSKMFSQIAIFYANDNKNIPRLDGYTDVVINKFNELNDYMLELCKRTEEIRKGIINPKYDNMLKVSTDGRKAALDLTLVNKVQPYNKYSKVYRCVENIMKIYNEFPDTTQLIFCDYSTPKASDFNVYAKLKENLITAGIPEKQIAFIHSYQTESRKVELFRKFNAGEKRILIGSTFKLGIGANVQVKLKAIHHLDVPWRPADMVQREGRILRQGNTNDDVMIYRYITEGSFDSYSWQILETKQRFISQFLSGSSYQRTASELESNVLTYSEVKAIALSQPFMKILAEKENELKNLHILIAKENEIKEETKKELNKINIESSELLKFYCAALSHRETLFRKSNQDFLKEYHRIQDVFSYEIVTGKKFYNNNISLLGFKICVPDKIDIQKPVIFLEKDNNKYMVSMGESTEGNAKRIINFLKRFNKTVDELREKSDKLKTRIKELEILIAKENHNYETQITECEAEINAIKSHIKVSGEEAIKE